MYSSFFSCTRIQVRITMLPPLEPLFVPIVVVIIIFIASILFYIFIYNAHKRKSKRHFLKKIHDNDYKVERIQREYEQRMRRQMDNWEQHVRQTTIIAQQGELPPPYEEAWPSSTAAEETTRGDTTPISERTDHQAIAIPPPAYKDHRQDTRVR